MGEFSCGYPGKRGNLIAILAGIFTKFESDSKSCLNSMKTKGKHCLDRFYTLSEARNILPERLREHNCPNSKMYFEFCADLEELNELAL